MVYFLLSLVVTPMRSDSYFKLIKSMLLDSFIKLSIFFAVLSGTKYGLKQTRGKFGLGAKMVGTVLYTEEITLFN